MESVGTVVSVAEDYASVRVARSSACGESCATCMGCKKEDKDLMTQAVNLICAKPGDSVRLESSTAQTLLLAITLYLVPVLLLLVGMMIHPLLGIGLLIGSLLLLIPFQKIFAKRGGIRVTIAAILPKE